MMIIIEVYKWQTRLTTAAAIDEMLLSILICIK